MPTKAKYYVYSIIAAGALLASLVFAGGLHLTSTITFAVYLTLAIVSSMFKMRLPGMEGTYSLNALFVLFGLYYLSPGETIIAGCAGAVMQSYWRAKQRPTGIQVAFNLGNLTLSIGVAFFLTHLNWLQDKDTFRPALMAAAAFVQFAVNTLIVSGVLALLQGKSLKPLWEQWYQWSFPYYLVGAVLVSMLSASGRLARPEAWVALLPPLYLIHFFCSLTVPSRKASSIADSGEVGMQLPPEARLFVNIIVGVGAVLLAVVVANFETIELARLLACLAVGLITTTWKVRLPGMRATISVGFVVTLFAVAELPFSQTVLIGAAMAILQVTWKPKHGASLLQTVFSVASLVIGSTLAHYAVHNVLPAGDFTGSIAATLALATAVLFLVNTLLISTAVCLSASKPLTEIWKGCYFWAFPYYLAGACAAGVMVLTARAAGWLPSALVLPLMGMVYVSYRYHMGQAVMRARASVSVKSQTDPQELVEVGV